MLKNPRVQQLALQVGAGGGGLLAVEKKVPGTIKEGTLLLRHAALELQVGAGAVLVVWV